MEDIINFSEYSLNENLQPKNHIFSEKGISFYYELTDTHMLLLKMKAEDEKIFTEFTYKNVFKKETWKKGFDELKYLKPLKELEDINLIKRKLGDESPYIITDLGLKYYEYLKNKKII